MLVVVSEDANVNIFNVYSGAFDKQFTLGQLAVTAGIRDAKVCCPAMEVSDTMLHAASVAVLLRVCVRECTCEYVCAPALRGLECVRACV